MAILILALIPSKSDSIGFGVATYQIVYVGQAVTKSGNKGLVNIRFNNNNWGTNGNATFITENGARGNVRVLFQNSKTFNIAGILMQNNLRWDLRSNCVTKAFKPINFACEYSLSPKNVNSTHISGSLNATRHRHECRYLPDPRSSVPKGPLCGYYPY
ncbi:hypothetical protein HRE53_32320 (plasmid) [Acaryochloris sp. 'Moss Beach']|uniref:hypothetical protein n=1 Tax=Acaryochloris sp. 'Moss Beach' TaxID=2740837 RepID=UPI001F427C72|nr:hypothetical protein [Acaryochloris sp. 'Moss Beach']UJB73333.1 hypothetical protein HRE53_32320 [Acaryochloris sp. 'Moss Beach']